MAFSKCALVSVVFFFCSYVHAHMIMATPVPYGKSNLNNSPLNADGSDYPCKQRTGVYDAEGANNEMALGSTQPLSFIGTAVHGGGSCQISVTYDLQPTESSVFKVIQSIEGGCPAMNTPGNLEGDNANLPDPYTYNFTVPDELPTGNATLAWTWMNRIGNREMYMNCAPVTLTGGSSKRDLVPRDTNAFYNSLPDMFVANIGNDCGTVDSMDTLYPDPGDAVQSLGTASNLAAPTGAGCMASSAGSIPSSAASQTSSVVASQATYAPDTSAPPSSTGISIAVASIPLATSVVAPSATATASSSSGGNGSLVGTQTAGTPCSTEGEFNCIGGSSFQQCASGVWSVVQQMAAGTVCTTGQSSSLQIAAGKHKRSVRFSRGHLRRRGF